MAESYKIIKSPTEGYYKEKGSKFLAFAYCVENLEDVKNHVAQLKKEYYDARHHCFAHIINHGHSPLSEPMMMENLIILLVILFWVKLNHMT